jgi:hypothetical protein
MKTRLLVIMFSILIFTTLFAAGAVHAQTSQGFVQLTDTSQSPMLNQAYRSGDLATYINSLFKIAISVGAILAVIRLAYAGYLYMTTEAWGEKSNAKEVIGDAMLGLLLLLSIYLILYQINPDIVSLKFLDKIKPVNNTPQSQNYNPGPSSNYPL